MLGGRGCFKATRLFLLLHQTLNSGPVNAPHPLPPTPVYFPGECADSLPCVAESLEKDKLSIWVRISRSGQELVGSIPTC